MTTLNSPAELRGVWVPRPLKRDWECDGVLVVYTPGFESYAFSDDEDDVFELIEDICTDLERGEFQALSASEKHHAHRRGVRFHTAPKRHGKGVIHMVVGIEWSEDDNGKLLWTITYRRQFDGPPPADVLAAEEEA